MTDSRNKEKSKLKHTQAYVGMRQRLFMKRVCKVAWNKTNAEFEVESEIQFFLHKARAFFFHRSTHFVMPHMKQEH